MFSGRRWTARSAADVPLAVAIAATTLLTLALVWGNAETREALETRLAEATERQNELTHVVANMTAEIDQLMEELTNLEARRAALEKRRDAVALGGRQLEAAKVADLRSKAKKELRRVHDIIDASKKELLEFLKK